MKLVPVTGVLATVHKLAEVDPQAAEVLVEFALFDALEHQIAAHRDELDRYGDQIIAKQTARARTALLRRSVGKALHGDDTVDETEVAQGLAILDAYVEKGLNDSLQRIFNRKHPRDSGGRFVPVGQGDQNTGLGNRNQSRHAEVMEHIDRWKKSGLLDDNGTVSVQMGRVDPATGRQVSERGPVVALPVTGAKEELYGHLAGDPTLTPTGVGLRRNSIPGGLAPQRRAALDAMQMFAGPKGTGESALAAAQSLPGQGDLRGSNAAGRWNTPSEGTDRQSYRRMSMTGRALAGATTAGSSANMVGQLASLIGDLGPEAEDVLGPSIRRTAYRYRGTERRPAMDVVRDVTSANVDLDKLNSGNPQLAAETRAKFSRATAASRPGGRSPITAPSNGVGAYYAGTPGNRLTPDGLDLRTRGDVAAITLRRRVPSMNTARLSMEAGELPPSIGLMLNAKGEVISEAQGFNGDHYLPFDLKNLRGLQGGQYVRTRAIGGLTTEDLYTGLLSGARQMQVISNSGVFTVELDPSIRGGRRYTDKATRMIGRYGKLLEAVDQGKIYLHDIDPGEQRKMKADALEQANYDEKLAGEIFDDDLRIARLKQAAIGDDEIEAQVRRELPPGAGRRDVADAVTEAVQRQRQTGVRTTKLDGDGYAAAMASLMQEFPFFIRDVAYQPLPEFMQSRYQEPQEKRTSIADRGHVRPGQTNPRLPGAPQAITAARAQPQEQGQTQGRPESVGDAAAVAQRTGAPRPTSAQTTTNVEAVGSPRVTRAIANMAGVIRPLVDAYADQKLTQPAEGEPESTFTPAALAYRKITSGTTADFAEWLTQQATPTEATRVMTGLKAMRKWGEGVADDDKALITDGEDWDTVQAQIGHLENLSLAAAPYAVLPDDGDFTMHRTTSEDKRPAAVPEVVALGHDLEAFDRFIAQPKNKPIATMVEAQGPGGSGLQQIAAVANTLANQLEDLQQSDPNGRESKVKSVQAKEVQTAWAFMAGRDAAETIEAFLGPDARPKGAAGSSPVGKSSQRRLIFHDAQSPFAKRARQAMQALQQQPRE